MSKNQKTRRVWIIAAGLCLALLALGFAWDSLVGNRFLTFYGRVVDEAGNGIPGVEIHMHTTRRSWFTIPFLLWTDNAMHGERVVVTDESGDFHLRLRGSYMLIDGVNAPGYYAKDSWSGLRMSVSTQDPSDSRGRSRDSAVIFPMVKGTPPPPQRLRP